MNRYPHTILATCCVPWSQDGTVDEALFRDSIRILLGHQLRHLYVFGTAGEGYAVNEFQFDEVVRIFSDEMRDGAGSPMVGVISLSLSTVIERIERCAEQGIAAFQISLPSWAELTEAEMFRFFDETCGRFPHLKFMHYNLMRSRRLVSPAQYADLAQRHPNLVATKNAGANQAATVALLDQAPQLRHFFTEPGFPYASLIGEAGLLLSVASINPTLAHEFFQAGVRGDVATLTLLSRELAAITATLTQCLGGDRIDGAYDKCFNKLLDLRFPLRLLPPYTGASDEDFSAFAAAVVKHHPHWLAGTSHLAA